MARPEAEPPQRDDLDALFDPDPNMDDMFSAIRRQKESDANASPRQGEVIYGTTKKTTGDEVDEEIKITKKRAPIAKLDYTRLLSDNGILKLQKLSKTQFKKFKGKGHEFSDVARLLRLYQLWLDDLYPRAKFADGLAIIEKLGHSRSMQMQRRSWIEAGKPKESVEDGGDVAPDEDEDLEFRSRGEHGGDIVRAGSGDSEASVDPFTMEIDQRQTTSGGTGAQKSGNEEPDEDELDALLAAESGTFIPNAPVKNGNVGPDEDELDALLAAEEMTHETTKLTSRPAQQKPPPQEPSFDDDEEAMRDMDDVW